MSLAPFVLGHNLFNVSGQYPDHTVTANEEAIGHEAFRVGNGRRSVQDYWAPTTTNNPAWLNVYTNGIAFSPDMIVLDRGHNLAGKTILLKRSTDNFATNTTTVFTATIPTGTSVLDVDDANGVYTEEGAWIKRFTPASSAYWRLYINAMGAGLVPNVVGLDLGKSWAPVRNFELPWSEDDDEMGGDDFTTDAGWVGMARPWNRGAGTMRFKLDSASEYVSARQYLGRNSFFARHSPIWICYDDEEADRTMRVVRPKGIQGFHFDANWLNKRQGEISWVEHEALSR